VTTPIRLRPATPADAKLIFGWRNDPFIVDRGSSRKTVDWRDHLNWLTNVLTDTNHLVYIALANGEPIGQVRFDRKSKMECVISAYLLERHTGKGLGVRVIELGCDMTFSLWDVDHIIACVLKKNAPAQSAFRKAGFIITPFAHCPSGHLRLILNRTDRTREVNSDA
jgi:UDP-2,4-diacetamido-2,4,6-trideoxy-beta-L-altropyranose hydrolase